MDELGGIEGVGNSVEEVGDGEAAGRKLFLPFANLVR